MKKHISENIMGAIIILYIFIIMFATFYIFNIFGFKNIVTPEIKSSAWVDTGIGFVNDDPPVSPDSIAVSWDHKPVDFVSIIAGGEELLRVTFLDFEVNFKMISKNKKAFLKGMSMIYDKLEKTK